VTSGVYVRTEKHKQAIRNNAMSNPNFGFKGHTHTEESRQKNREKHLGKHFSPETEFKKGTENPRYWLGKHRSEETKEKLRIKTLEQLKDGMPQTTKDKISKSCKETFSIPEIREKLILSHNTKECKEKLSLARKNKTWEEIYGIEKANQMKENQSKKLKGRISPMKDKKHTDETKEKCRVASIKYWQDPEYREKVIKNSLNGLLARPTSLEKQMIKLIEENKLPYMYVGDGSFFIGWKCPDFIENNGRKIVLEVRPKVMCQFWDKCTPEEYEQRQKEHYAKFSYDCIIIWQEDLENDMWREKLMVK